MRKSNDKKGNEKTNVKSRKRNKRGMKPLSEVEPTERATVNLPASMFAELQRRANKKSISAYLRSLVESDLKRVG